MACHHITVTFRIEVYFSLLYNASHNMMIAVRFLSFLFCQLVFLRWVFKNPTIDFNALFNSLGNSTCSSPEVVLACLLYEGSTIHNASNQFISCVYFFFVDFIFHPSPQTKIGSVCANFKQLYLHTH